MYKEDFAHVCLIRSVFFERQKEAFHACFLISVKLEFERFIHLCYSSKTKFSNNLCELLLNWLLVRTFALRQTTGREVHHTLGQHFPYGTARVVSLSLFTHKCRSSSRWIGYMVLCQGYLEPTKVRPHLVLRCAALATRDTTRGQSQAELWRSQKTRR